VFVDCDMSCLWRFVMQCVCGLTLVACVMLVLPCVASSGSRIPVRASGLSKPLLDPPRYAGCTFACIKNAFDVVCEEAYGIDVGALGGVVSQGAGCVSFALNDGYVRCIQVLSKCADGPGTGRCLSGGN
jgi:hypothetical protein